MNQLPKSPDSTIVQITILTQLTTILLTELTNLASQKCRWSQVCSRQGISFLSFMSLGAVSPESLIALVSCPLGQLLRGKETLKSYHWIRVQR